MTTKTDVISWILTSADKQDLTDIFSIANERNRTLQRILEAQNSSYLQEGSRVTLTGLSPKYLNGLRGTVLGAPRRTSGKKTTIVCDVELDRPIYKGSRWGEKVVRGVPTACVTILDAVGK